MKISTFAKFALATPHLIRSEMREGDERPLTTAHKFKKDLLSTNPMKKKPGPKKQAGYYDAPGEISVATTAASQPGPQQLPADISLPAFNRAMNQMNLNKWMGKGMAHTGLPGMGLRPETYKQLFGLARHYTKTMKAPVKQAEHIPSDISETALNKAIKDMHGVHNIYNDKRFYKMVDRAREYTKQEEIIAKQRRELEAQQKEFMRLMSGEGKKPDNPITSLLKSFGVKL